MLLYEADFLLGEAAVRLDSTTMESFHDPELAPKYARKPIKKLTGV